MTYRNVAPPRRRPKRVLVVRMLVAKLAWLEGRPHWREGRVVWEGPESRIAPDAAELALAQRTLTRLASYPFASREALGDSEGWVRERRARLELAKHLRALSTPDLPALARQAQAGDARAVERLAALLTAEALCQNNLPVAPSAALGALGARAEAALCAPLEQPEIPVEGRALAALTLGAVHRAAGHLTARPAGEEPWPRRAYRWGRRAGLPAEAALVVALLGDERGLELAERYARLQSAPGLVRLEPGLLRELLAEGVPPAQVVALAEAAREADALAEGLRRRRRELPDRGSPQRRAIAAQLAEQRREAVAAFSELLNDYARASRQPEALRLLAEFGRRMLALGRVTRDLVESMTCPLRQGLDLPVPLLLPWLRVLVERHDELWDLSTLPAGQDTRRGKPRLSVWLDERWILHVRPALILLQRTGEPAIVHEALDRGLHRSLSCYEWPDGERYPVALTLSRDLCGPGACGFFYSLCQVLGPLPDAASARALLQPLVQAAVRAPLQARQHLLEALLDEVPLTRQAIRDALPRLVRYVPRLVRFADEDKDANCACGAAVSAALQFDRAVPERAESWLDWLLTHLTSLSRPGESRYETRSVRIGVGLGLTLAGDDFAHFQAIVGAAVRHTFHQDREHLERGMPLLARYPGLREPLARLFATQPQRCAELLVRLGLATRLNPEALTPLSELEVVGADAAVPPASGWAELPALPPGLAATVRRYARAQELLGASAAPPPGVRRALELPRRLEGELAFIEKRLESEPGRADLAARARSLRARLADKEQLLAQSLAEARERLEQVTAIAQMAAAEQQVQACYRERLAAVVGPLPEALRFDTDLLNATLLTVDIDQNRRLLLRLLRAHLAGERDWREQHPANAAFLQALAASGVDGEAWLGAHPRRYPCPGAAGARVHLRLEREPLRILQMGNYFDTCLSFGGCNSFATVANACELNKRVVYAQDGAGHVVGRKLVAINSEGALVGFQTYCSLPDDGSNRALRAIFRHYLRGFAERCGLSLAEDGEVPRLFAQSWYDDGIVGWDDDEAEESGSPSASPQRRPK